MLIVVLEIPTVPLAPKMEHGKGRSSQQRIHGGWRTVFPWFLNLAESSSQRQGILEQLANDLLYWPAILFGQFLELLHGGPLDLQITDTNWIQYLVQSLFSSPHISNLNRALAFGHLVAGIATG